MPQPTVSEQLQAIQDKIRYERQFEALMNTAGFRFWSDADAIVASMSSTSAFGVLMDMPLRSSNAQPVVHLSLYARRDTMADDEFRAALVAALRHAADALETPTAE